MPKDFITFLDYSRAEIEALLDRTVRMRDAHHARNMPRALAAKTLPPVRDGAGFRNRVAFELGIASMGGIAVQVPGRLDESESIEDVTAYLNNRFDAIVARVKPHSFLQRLAAAATVPVINARTDYNHPCEVLGDLAYLRARRGGLDGLCPPVHRGEEVSTDAMTSPACCVFEAKDYLLHAQNARLGTLLPGGAW
jgi:ornithine carbamoyltransferase